VALAARETMPDASAEELHFIAERHASLGAARRTRGLGIFVPPHTEGRRQT
jgi:hypothetical protein